MGKGDRLGWPLRVPTTKIYTRSMAKTKSTISYTPEQIPPRTSWTLPTRVSREEVPRLCRGLRYMMTELYGATFYYPDASSDKTTCRYEWHTKWQTKRFGTKLGVHFEVANGPVNEISAYAAPGHDHPLAGGVPAFDARQLSRYQKKVAKVLDGALRRQAPEAKRRYHLVYYLQPPPFSGVKEPVSLVEHSVAVLPTVIVGRESKRASAVIHTVEASFLTEARELGFQRHMMLCALLTLARGLPFTWLSLQWPRNRTPVESVEAIDPMPSLGVIYPHGLWQACNDPSDQDFGRRLQSVLSLYSRLSVQERDDYEDPILTYYAGKEIEGKQPTMAMVAFLAAVSSLTKPEKCHGDVLCSRCGPLLQPGGGPFRHNKVGDREALVNSVCKMFQAEPGTASHGHIKDIITRAYRHQRSPFVHGAMLQHEEYKSLGNTIAAEPTEEAPFSETHLYGSDLRAVEHIARRALLVALADRSTSTLDTELFDLRREDFQPQVRVAACATLARGVPVGFIRQPSRERDAPGSE